MGGASTQITFTSSKAAQHSSKLKLYGTKYQLYTHSYLCYGKKEAERRFYAQLVKVSTVKVRLSSKGLLLSAAISETKGFLVF